MSIEIVANPWQMKDNDLIHIGIMIWSVFIIVGIVTYFLKRADLSVDNFDLDLVENENGQLVPLSHTK